MWRESGNNEVYAKQSAFLRFTVSELTQVLTIEAGIRGGRLFCALREGAFATAGAAP